MVSMALAVADMTDGRPVSADTLMSISVESLVRGNVDTVVSQLAHLNEDWVFDRVVQIWERVRDRGIFEESHRHNAARALFTLAGAQEEKDLVYDLLSELAQTADDSWVGSYLWLVNQLGTEEAISFSQTALVDLYSQYRLSPVLAAIFLAYGFRTLGSVDLLREVERLFDDSESSRYHYRIADYLDSFRFERSDDEDRVTKILDAIRDRSDRVQAIFKAEQALYNRGLIDLP